MFETMLEPISFIAIEPTLSFANGDGKSVSLDFKFLEWLREQYEGRRDLFPTCDYCGRTSFRLNMREGVECCGCGATV